MIPYVPTYTAPAIHVSIQEVFRPFMVLWEFLVDKTTNANVYCTDDSTVASVGSNTVWGKMSPANLWTTTITVSCA